MKRLLLSAALLALVMSGVRADTTSAPGGAAGYPLGRLSLARLALIRPPLEPPTGLQVNAALPAGSNLIGKTSIDQTTPGTTNGVQVNAALPAGTNGIGNVGGRTVTVCVTPTVTATNSYGTNYVVGGKLTFSNAFTATGTGILQSVAVTIAKVETSGFTFFTFTSDPSATTWTDAAVAAINATDVPKVRGPIGLVGNSQLGTHTIAYADAVGAARAPVSTTLYGVLIANAALTNQFAASTDVQVCVTTLQDL